MEKNDIASICEAAVAGCVLNVTSFGSTEKKCIWIEAKALVPVARALRDHEKTQTKWLENISVMEVEQSLVLNYFVASDPEAEVFVLRVTLLPNSPESEVQIDSLSQVWPVAEVFERENTGLFGVRFLGLEESQISPLPKDWIGYPLRKTYVYPQEYLGIPHFRNKAGVSL